MKSCIFFRLYTFASFQTQEMNTKKLFTKQNPARFLFYSAFMFAQSKTLFLIGFRPKFSGSYPFNNRVTGIRAESNIWKRRQEQTAASKLPNGIFRPKLSSRQTELKPFQPIAPPPPMVVCTPMYVCLWYAGSTYSL